MDLSNKPSTAMEDTKQIRNSFIVLAVTMAAFNLVQTAYLTDLIQRKSKPCVEEVVKPIENPMFNNGYFQLEHNVGDTFSITENTINGVPGKTETWVNTDCGLKKITTELNK